MTYTIVQGFLTGLAYVAPIGMQNLYVIQASLREERKIAWRVVLFTVFFDISLALSCFFGIGLLIERIPFLRYVIMGLGSVMVFYIGLSLIRAKVSVPGEAAYESEGWRKHLVRCFAVTWLNPQAIIDGTLFLGGFRASMDQSQSTLFILGVSLASLIWFHGLFLFTSVFHQKMSVKVLRILNMLCGSLLMFYALKLFVNFIQQVFLK